MMIIHDPYFNRYVNEKPPESFTIECWMIQLYNMEFLAYHFPYLLIVLFWNWIENLFRYLQRFWMNTKYYVNEEQKLYSI